MNKTALKNFAIWERLKLISDIGTAEPFQFCLNSCGKRNSSIMKETLSVEHNRDIAERFTDEIIGLKRCSRIKIHSIL